MQRQTWWIQFNKASCRVFNVEKIERSVLDAVLLFPGSLLCQTLNKRMSRSAWCRRAPSAPACSPLISTSPCAARALAREAEPGAAQSVCQPVQRANVRAGPAARPAHTPGAHHCCQQYFERSVPDRRRHPRRCQKATCSRSSAKAASPKTTRFNR